MDLRSIIEKLDKLDSKKNLMEDAATIANTIKKAVVRWGTDEVAVYDAIAQITSAAEWEQVKKVYAADGRDIEADIANDFGGTELDYVRGLLASKGIKSETLRIGEPTDHLTPVEPNTPPPPPAEPEGKSDDKNQGKQSMQPEPASATAPATDLNTKAWETAFGGTADRIVSWVINKYPKVTPELVKEYLKSTPPVGDDVAVLNQINSWAKDPHTVKEPTKLDFTKLRMWENVTNKPLSYIVAFAKSLHQSNPYVYKREVTDQEVKEFLVKTEPPNTGDYEYDKVASFKLIKKWAESETAVDVSPTLRDPDVEEIKRLLDKADAKAEKTEYTRGDLVWDPRRNTYYRASGANEAKESNLPIAKSLVESFGYILEAYKDLSVAEQKELDELAIELEPFAKTDRKIGLLIKAYKKLKGG